MIDIITLNYIANSIVHVHFIKNYLPAMSVKVLLHELESLYSSIEYKETVVLSTTKTTDDLVSTKSSLSSNKSATMNNVIEDLVTSYVIRKIYRLSSDISWFYPNYK